MSTPVKKMTLVSLAIPILIEQVLRNLMGTVNVFMLSNTSDAAVASVGVANQILNIIVITFTIISAGAGVVINHALGAKHYDEAGELSMNAVTTAVALGVVTSAVMLCFAEPLVRLVGLEEALVTDAANYLRIIGGSSIVVCMTTMLSNIFRSYGNARLPMATVILNNILNIAGTYVVVFRPFETPLAGVVGVATVRAVSEAVGLVFLAVMLMRAGFGFRAYDLVHVKLANVRRTLSIGVMSGMEGINFNLGQVVTTSFLTGFGTVALSAKVYVQNVDTYAYLIGLAIGQATQILTGHQIGAGDLDGAHRQVNRNWRYVALSNVTMGVLMFLFAKPLMSLFTADPEIIAVAQKLFFINIFIHAGRSMNHSFNYGLRSAGYVFVPMILATLSIWGLNVGSGYLFSTVLEMGIIGLWIAQLADEWCRGLASCWIWNRKFWMKGLRERAKS